MQCRHYKRTLLALIAAAAAAPFASAAPAPTAGVQEMAHIGPQAPATSYGIQPAGLRRYFRTYGKRWIPGHWTTESQRVWEPGQTTQVWVPPVFATHYDPCGAPIKVLVTPGHYKTVTSPGCWVSKRVRVWKAGYWC
ncbi:MAG: hypothetical protein ACYTFV_12025 [Planctomycetota bacterium]|jgi:hypothetical protein